MHLNLTAIVMLYCQAEFQLAAHTLKQTPEDSGFEVAFAGRSNAGKSSAINCITQRNGLARTSKTPGRTQQIIFFQLDEQRRLVDLPGYGYAKVPLSVKAHWQKTLSRYLETRESLKGLILLMDIRHPLTEHDQNMLTWSLATQLPTHILLTKSDKLKRGAMLNAAQKVRSQCQKLWPNSEHLLSLQVFSALKRTGIEEAHGYLNKWLEVND